MFLEALRRARYGPAHESTLSPRSAGLCHLSARSTVHHHRRARAVQTGPRRRRRGGRFRGRGRLARGEKRRRQLHGRYHRLPAHLRRTPALPRFHQCRRGPSRCQRAGRGRFPPVGALRISAVHRHALRGRAGPGRPQRREETHGRERQRALRVRRSQAQGAIRSVVGTRRSRRGSRHRARLAGRSRAHSSARPAAARRARRLRQPQR